MKSLASCLAVLWALAAWSVAAEPRIRATFTSEPPKIDGRTDDPAWKAAAPATTFAQHEPVHGNPPGERTEVRVLWDAAHLYIAFDCDAANTKRVLASTTERDSPFFSDDHVGVYLDTFYDRRNCYAFLVNALGTQRDMRIANEGLNQSQSRFGDSSWDATWQAEVFRSEDRWSAELSIPFAVLRFDRNGDVWGINFWRNIEAVDQELTWADVGSRTYNVSKFGTIVGLEPSKLERGKLLAVTPYFTASPRQKTGEDFDLKPKGGIDFQYPLTGITFDFTINPDFAQIEADPSQVNLSDVELRLQEKRPFFLEGGEIYQAPIELFYSRRIEDLKAGAKMAGKLGSNEVAFVSAQAYDLDEQGAALDDLANYTAMRYKRDIMPSVGIGLLGANRQYPALDQTNGAGGFDANIRLPHDITIVGQIAANWDRNRTSLEGELPPAPGWHTDHAAFLRADWRTNTWRYSLMAADIGPDFLVDTGFIERTDRRGGRTELGYRRQFEDSFVSRVGWEFNYERLEDSTGSLRNERLSPEFNVGFGDLFFFGGPQRYYRVEDDGMVFRDETVELFTGYFPPEHVQVRVFQNLGYRDGARKWFISPALVVRPVTRWQIEYSQQREVKRRVSTQPWKLVNRVQRIQSRMQFTRDSFASGSFETDLAHERRFFVLFGTEYRPRSFFYIVYNERRFTEEGQRVTDRAVFLKLSYQAKVL